MFAIPVLVIEILAIIGLLTYLILLPKNSCKINTNYDNAIVYVNSKKTNKLRLKTPDTSMDYYLYEFDVHLLIPENGNFNVDYSLSCDKYKVFAKTHINQQGDNYSLSVQGNTKTLLLTGITIKSEEPIKNFTVYIDVEITKLN